MLVPHFKTLIPLDNYNNDEDPLAVRLTGLRCSMVITRYQYKAYQYLITAFPHALFWQYRIRDSFSLKQFSACVS